MNKRILPKNAILVPKEAEQVFSGKIFDIYQWQQKMYDGSYSTFEMAKRPDTILIIGVVNDKIIVLDEKQPNGTERFSDLPGGRVDLKDRSMLEAAKREMLEETGYSFSNWKLINVLQPQIKIEYFIYLFVAWGVIDKKPQHIDEGEEITVKELSWQDFSDQGPKNTIFENDLQKYSNTQELISTKEFS